MLENYRLGEEMLVVVKIWKYKDSSRQSQQLFTCCKLVLQRVSALV